MTRIGAVILAAGSAARMGRQKLLLPLAGRPLLDYVLATAAKLPLADCVAVIGEPQEELQELCRHRFIRTIHNQDYRTGQASSIRRGISCLSTELDGMLFLLGDQPLLPVELVLALIDTFHKKGHQQVMVVANYQGQYRSPVLFGSGWRHQLGGLTGDEGGRLLLRQYPSSVLTIPWPQENVFWDADTVEDYQRLVQYLQENQVLGKIEEA